MFATLYILGITAHLFADFFLQNEWQATRKNDLSGPAGWVHAALHLLCLWPVFGFQVAFLLAVIHLLIDTRIPLQLWRKTIKQTNDPANPAFMPFAMLQDQAAHLICIAIAAYAVSERL